MALRLYTSPNDCGKTDKEGKDPEWKSNANMKGMTSTTPPATIKRKTRGEEEDEKKKQEPREAPNHSMGKRLPYAEKEGEEDETGSKVALIFQETQAEEAAARDNKTCRKKTAGDYDWPTVAGNLVKARKSWGRL